MKSDNIYIKVLGGSITVFVISTIVSLGMVFGSNYFQQQMLLEFNRANATFQSISSRYLAVDEEEKLIRGYLPDFVKLYESGVIGDEQRLNWVEVLRNAGDSIKLPSLNYQIESQQVYTPPYTLSPGKFKVYSSKMMLNMQLLHEGDLFRILESLDRNARGSYSISSCSKGQSSSVITDEPDGSNISARCELLWLSIKLADGKPIKV
jgi:hypothetical protein